MPNPRSFSGGETAESEDNTYLEQLVVMRLGCEDYGIDITAVREIIRMPNITIVPQAPPHVEGIINLRGSVVPVVDLRKRFGLTAAEQTTDSRIVVVDVKGHTLGLVVDGVTEVISVSRRSIEPVGSIAGGSPASDLRGIVNLPEKLISLIDLERLLDIIAGERLEEEPRAA